MKIAIDLDGTLATYEKGLYPEIGELIEETANLVREGIENGHTFVIFTARLNGSVSRTAMKARIQTWLQRHGLPRLEVTDVKKSGFDQIWDDRAIRLVHNTGYMCAGCEVAREAYGNSN